jgi:hypothetical protein
MKNDFEYQIDKLIKYINDNKLGHAHKNHPNRLFNGKYIGGEPFDYEIFTKDHKYVFDAKETHSAKWKILNKDIKQAKNLLACHNAGLEAFFLIYFYQKKEYRRLNIIDFIEIVKSRKYVGFDDCDTFKF